MAEHLMKVIISIVFILLPVFNTIQLLKINKILSKN